MKMLILKDGQTVMETIKPELYDNFSLVDCPFCGTANIYGIKEGWLNTCMHLNLDATKPTSLMVFELEKAIEDTE